MCNSHQTSSYGGEFGIENLAWERERGFEFTYDGIHLLTMLEEYNILRHEKEERLRKRITVQEAIYGTKPSPSKTPKVKKISRASTGSANRRLSHGGTLPQTPKVDLHSAKTKQMSRRKGWRNTLQDAGLPALSAGGRGLDVNGLPVKKQSLNPSDGYEPERKPFSPVSLNTNATTLLDDINNNGRDMSFIKFSAPPVIMPTTPGRTVAVADEENRTPKIMGILMPETPSTVSVPMQTAMTLAPAVPVIQFGVLESEVSEEIEYSFEERRWDSLS